MKSTKPFFFPSVSILLFLSACSSHQIPTRLQDYGYIVDNQQLYNEIISMDSTFFHAYNNCDMDKQAAIYGDSLEFYHDKGGLTTSKQAILDATEKNICGKVTRELVKGSVEVYSIKDYGAVELGLHKFHNNQEPAGTPSKASKFIIMWKRQNNVWRITKVISLH
jgi:ketosteroid isomerase-like protein